MHIRQRLPYPALPARGVTLIEMMIVVTILGIIAAIGFPAYIDHVRKGHRTSAQSHMLSMASLQGEIMADSHTYAASAELATLLPTPPAVSKFYTISVRLGTAPPSYTITATPYSTQSGDGTLSLTSDGKRLPEGKW